MAKQSATTQESEIHVNMLGSFTIFQTTDSEAADSESVKDAEITASLSGRAHRLWLLIAYLVVNRDHGVPPQELIDLLWPEVTSSNPASTLQNNVSRARTIFGDANFTDARNMIRYTDGLYHWAPDMPTTLDAEIMEQNAARVENEISPEDPESLEFALQTCRLYKGDFLSGASDVAWCANLAVYYRAIYKHLCKTTIAALLEADRLTEAQELCHQVLALDPAAEEFNVFLMRTLIMDGDAAAALEHYQKVEAYLAETYDIRPGAELEIQREAALQELYGQSMTEESIRNFLFESTDEEGAFACSNAVFREIVLLHLREMSRSGTDSHIIAITIDTQMLRGERRVINAKRVAQVLSYTLRSSDPFTKVGSNQFLVLLPSANRENAQMVFERITARFKEEFPHAAIALKVSMVSLGAFQ